MLLNDETCEFLTGGVVILLASRSEALMPSVARAKGCRIMRGERPALRVIVSAAHAGQLLDDVRASGMVSATFSRPTTHRSLQFKGSDARIESAVPEDHAVIGAYLDALAGELRPLGFSDEFRRTFFASPPDEVVIVFTPADAFQQTPGPAAGARIA